MKLTMYAAKDIKLGGFGNIFLANNDREATRGCETAVNNPQSGLMHTHTSDFTLYNLGTFDTESGLIATSGPSFVLDLIHLKRVHNQDPFDSNISPLDPLGTQD